VTHGDMKIKSDPPGEATWNRVAGINQALFDVCVRNARICGDEHKYEELLQWGSVAAWSAAGQGWFGELSSRELEVELLRAARQLPLPAPAGGRPPRPRWLHVLSEAYATLGHTNLCRRWMLYDQIVIHDVILVDQKSVVPQNLVDAVKSAGGRCVVLDPAASLMQRAAELRKYAWEHVDMVVLHTHPAEVLATAAFGVEGGPPVLVVNHADHVFWAGCSIADMVLDIRMSGHLWTKQLRGVDRAMILPIPLVENDRQGRPANVVSQERQALRQSLGIPDNAVLLLTVGSPAKYEPMPGLDFVTTAREILRVCGDAYLVAIGPRDEGVWKAARKATNGRIMALGYQPDSALFCRAADLYIEGFPLGSLTAMLEAGEEGLPCICSPSVPPFRSDSLSLDECPQPGDVPDYIRAVAALVGDAQLRARCGVKLQETIRAQHCAPGWQARLNEIKAKLPGSHNLYPDFRPGKVETGLRNWFLHFQFKEPGVPTAARRAEDVFVEAWRRTDSQPQLDSRLGEELSRFGQNGRVEGWSIGPHEILSLTRVNRRIRARGDFNRFMRAVRDAFRNGDLRLARKLTYRCFWANPGCLLDANWIRQFAKAHLGPRLIFKLQTVFSRPGRQFHRRQLAVNQ